MCDISKKTNLKRKVVYKVVFKREGGYYSCVVGSMIQEGLVLLSPATKYYKDFVPTYYNPNMDGRVSGFASKGSAMLLIGIDAKYNIFRDYNVFKDKVVILKITLGGSIMKGTAKGFLLGKDAKRITYAGTEIIDFEEITI